MLTRPLPLTVSTEIYNDLMIYFIARFNNVKQKNRINLNSMIIAWKITII